MERSLQAATVNIPAAAGQHEHGAQDSVGVNWLNADGSEVLVGAVSDGCSDASESKTGSQWLVETFGTAAKNSYIEGHRGETLGWQIVRRLLRELWYKMCDLQERAEQTLAATLLGVVADSEQVVVVIAGSGTFSLNGSCYEVKQDNHDLYPIDCHRHPQRTANPRAIAEDVFRVLVLPTSGVQSLVLCSDGMDVGELYRLIQEFYDNPTQLAIAICLESQGKPRYKGGVAPHTSDDTSMLAIFNQNANVEALCDPEILRQLCREYSSSMDRAQFFAKEYQAVAPTTVASAEQPKRPSPRHKHRRPRTRRRKQ